METNRVTNREAAKPEVDSILSGVKTMRALQSASDPARIPSAYPSDRQQIVALV